MNLMNYSKDKFEKSQKMEVLYPTGAKSGGVIYIRSLKSKAVQTKIDEIAKLNNQVKAQGVGAAVDNDIEIACEIVDSIDGFTIEEADNTIGFELSDGNKIVSTRENIKLLLENFPFIRSQIAVKAQDDNFFYKSSETEQKTA
ncbi:hypothetical protein MMG00_12235 [Ignatzschineria rhizosphaerae]|uniref:Uncharacterized protein n=1 Tax=Ignatzschineria rhizosphaerae TaxID=2923279 RepID=A0ABY3WZB2_9GAMM|nr:hypothetical protein [Ignatzschineria rhizosphaerae]UNM95954.1 hypothetical protein MMG00_12235 [Ignatzschineria rhizosphaerae]